MVLSMIANLTHRKADRIIQNALLSLFPRRTRFTPRGSFGGDPVIE